jgi:hypothetical protein
MRILIFVATAAAALLSGVGGASAQYYEPGNAPAYAHGYVQQPHANRVIVTRRPMPAGYGPAYPYVRQSATPLPYQPVPGYRYRRVRGHARAVAVRRAAPRPPAYRTVHRSGQAMHVKRGVARHAPTTQRRSVNLGNGTGRVIRAEAEVRIIGNDQMSIRLFRKRPATRAN